MPSIYMPTNVKLLEDPTLLYIKPPQEMSRVEIAELERELRALDDPVADELGESFL
jgi:hypothetical protein